MKTEEGKDDREIQGKLLYRQKEQGRTRRMIVNAIIVRRKIMWQKIVRQKVEDRREKGQKGGRDQIRTKQIRLNKSMTV